MSSRKYILENANILAVVAKEEAKTGKKLMARFIGDIVDGHITIIGNEVEVVLYE